MLFKYGDVNTSIYKHKSDLQSRCVGVAEIIRQHNTAECLGVCIEEPFSGQFSSVKALFPMIGAAVLACEECGLPWSLIHLSKLKIHATGKGNAKKSDMQAAAKGRWGRDFGEDEADAAWAAAYAADTGLFAE